MKKIVAVAAMAVILFTACKKEYTTNETNILAPKENDIVGFVTLFDEFGTRLGDNAGMKIAVENSTPALEATTDATGKFLLPKVKAGTYNLLYTKTGFGLFKRLSVTHAGGDAPTSTGNNNLWQTAQTLITNVTAVAGIGDTIIFSGKSSPIQPAGSSTTFQRRFRMFFAKAPTAVTYLNYDATFNQILIPAPVTGSNGDWTIKLRTANFSPLKAGDLINIIVYGLSPIENAYTDILTNRVIYSGVNSVPSNVVNITLQ